MERGRLGLGFCGKAFLEKWRLLHCSSHAGSFGTTMVSNHHTYANHYIISIDLRAVDKKVELRNIETTVIYEELHKEICVAPHWDKWVPQMNGLINTLAGVSLGSFRSFTSDRLCDQYLFRSDPVPLYRETSGVVSMQPLRRGEELNKQDQIARQGGMSSCYGNPPQNQDPSF